MIVDRIFEAAPRPFGPETIQQREYLTFEDFIYFMLAEEDKANEVSIRYWFDCLDVDADGKLNNMEMRSFYAVQLHRMQCMGHEIVPFEDMLCQMMVRFRPKFGAVLQSTNTDPRELISLFMLLYIGHDQAGQSRLSRRDGLSSLERLRSPVRCSIQPQQVSNV
jgi:hypothetical protein